MVYIKIFIIIIVLCFCPVVDNKNNKKMIVKMMESGDCRTRQFKPSNDDLLRLSIKFTIIGEQTFYDCNYTVVKKFGPAALTIRMYKLLANKEQKLIYKMDRISCSSLLTQQLLRLGKIPVGKNCTALPTSLSINGRIDKTTWIWTKGATNPGRYAYEVEISCRDMSVTCNRFVADVLEKKQR